ncbi:MAG: polysaccharide export protein [Alphaproteobacteria bacterium]|nr:polysaccharide export protein [Alphaproteobacteria bacterium]
MSATRFIQGSFFLLLLAGCGGLPASGPYSQVVSERSSIQAVSTPKEKLQDPSFRYALVDIRKPILNHLLAFTPAWENVIWPAPNQPEFVKVQVGDIISVTIYEARSGGLFIPTEAGVRPGNFVTLPPQTIDKSGFIVIPYVGLVQAQGRSPAEIGDAITRGLKERAVEPQVVVSFIERNGAEVSVLGAVNSAKRYSLGFEGDKILDAIAQAAGPSVPGYEAYVTLQRAGEEFTIPFDELLADPKKNVFLRTNDTIYVYQEPKTYMMYGAVENQGSYSFGKRKLMLSEALAKASGMRDTQADPSEIYLYRHEKRERIQDFADFSQYQADLKEAEIPVIYKLNLRDPDGFFMAQKFEIEEDDVIYIANAESVEFTKFLNIVSATSGTTESVDRTFLHNALK